MARDFDYAPGYSKPPIDLSFDREAALRVWEARLKMVEESGNFTNDNRQAKFFSGKQWTQETKVQYCKDMLIRIKTQNP